MVSIATTGSFKSGDKGNKLCKQISGDSYHPRPSTPSDRQLGRPKGNEMATGSTQSIVTNEKLRAMATLVPIVCTACHQHH